MLIFCFTGDLFPEVSGSCKRPRLETSFIQDVESLVCRKMTHGNIRQFGLKLLKGARTKLKQIIGDVSPENQIDITLMDMTDKWMDKFEEPPNWDLFLKKLHDYQGSEYNKFIRSLEEKLHEQNIGKHFDVPGC